jgi:hypothetical protein
VRPVPLSLVSRLPDCAPSYLNQSAAQAAGLIGVNDAQRAFLKVDNTTSDPNPGPYSTFGRNTVLLMSQDTISIGTLVALDAVHIPYGVRVFMLLPLTSVRYG